jgi:hypothetical protein
MPRTGRGRSRVRFGGQRTRGPGPRRAARGPAATWQEDRGWPRPRTSTLVSPASALAGRLRRTHQCVETTTWRRAVPLSRGRRRRAMGWTGRGRQQSARHRGAWPFRVTRLMEVPAGRRREGPNAGRYAPCDHLLGLTDSSLVPSISLGVPKIEFFTGNLMGVPPTPHYENEASCASAVARATSGYCGTSSPPGN